MGQAYSDTRSMLSRAQPKNVVTDSAALGKKVYSAAKKLKSGQKLASGMAPKLRSIHSTDIFSGMQARLQPISKPGGGVSHQRTYETFRTISENSSPDKWMHPGISARNYFNQLGDYIQKVAPGAVDAYIKGGT